MGKPKMLTVMDNALIKDWLTTLRDKNTSPEEFRRYIARITPHLVFEALCDLKTDMKTISTPLMKTVGLVVVEKVAVAVILRAALGMVSPIQDIIPSAKICLVDMHRDESTLKPIWGRNSIPSNCEGYVWLVPDPMLATGNSAIATINLLKERGAQKIVYMGIIAAREGISALQGAHHDVRIVVAAVDIKLSDGSDGLPKGYILPGLGDAGDRQFGTT